MFISQHELTLNMGNTTIAGISDDEVDEIETRAKRNGCSRSEYIRMRLRAGMRLWDAGDFDRNELDTLLSDYSDTQDSPATMNVSDEVAASIHRNLSTTDPTPLRDSSDDDLLDIIVEEIVIEALTELQRDGKIEHVPGQGYIKR